VTFEANGAAYPRAFDSDEESDADDDGDQDADVDPDDVSVWNDGSLDLPDESDDEEILPAGVNETLRPSLLLLLLLYLLTTSEGHWHTSERSHGHMSCEAG
jgi:hypothetical protein